MKRIVITIVSIIFVVGIVWAGMFYWNNLRGSKGTLTNSSGCRPSGCSGQICADEDVITTCEYKESFACYKKAKCERHTDGKCAWTLTQELLQCLGGKI